MTNNIRDDLLNALKTEYDRGYCTGYDQGRADTHADIRAALDDLTNPHLGAPPEQPVAPVRRRRRRLTPTEARVLDYVTANPGCTMADIDAAGITGRGTLYSLVARRKLVRREDPKPHTRGRPRVHFYPMEPRNAQT